MASGALFSQVTLIPDPAFEQRLINEGIDSDGIVNGQVFTDDINQIILLDVSITFPGTQPIITDLTGIQDFTALENLMIASNEVETMDLSNNLNLKFLNCKENNLPFLDITNNEMLETLDASNCFPGTCIQENKYPSLDLSNNINLKSLGVNYNSFIGSLDLSNNSLLEIAGVSGNNQLIQFNLKNGNNINLTIFRLLDNPNLSCIEVDDPVAATQGTTLPYSNWNVEEGVAFAEDCTLGIPQQLLGQLITLYPNPADTLLLITNNSHYSIETLTLYDMMGRQVLVEKENILQIDIASLQSGPYLVKIETELGVLHKKIIKN